MAPILREYLIIKTHPTIRAKELEIHVLDETLHKQGYALHQLLETSRSQGEIEEELRMFLEKSI